LALGASCPHSLVSATTPGRGEDAPGLWPGHSTGQMNARLAAPATSGGVTATAALAFLGSVDGQALWPQPDATAPLTPPRVGHRPDGPGFPARARPWLRPRGRRGRPLRGRSAFRCRCCPGQCRPARRPGHGPRRRRCAEVSPGAVDGESRERRRGTPGELDRQAGLSSAPAKVVGGCQVVGGGTSGTRWNRSICSRPWVRSRDGSRGFVTQNPNQTH
jgi:hypothetical protein